MVLVFIEMGENQEENQAGGGGQMINLSFGHIEIKVNLGYLVKGDVK